MAPALAYARILAAFCVRDARELASYRTVSALQILQPVVAAVTLYFSARLVRPDGPMAPYAGDYLAFASVGMALLQVSHALTSSPAVRLRQEMVQGTLEALCAVARGPVQVCVGNMVFQGLVAVVRGALLLSVAFALGAGFSVRPLALLATLAASALALAALGMLASAATLVVQRVGPVVWGLSTLIVLLSGVAYPVSVLPPLLQRCALVLPTTAALEALRSSLLPLPGSPWGPVAVLAGFAAAGLPVGVLCLRLAERRARRLGQLGTY